VPSHAVFDEPSPADISRVHDWPLAWAAPSGHCGQSEDRYRRDCQIDQHPNLRIRMCKKLR